MVKEIRLRSLSESYNLYTKEPIKEIRNHSELDKFHSNDDLWRIKSKVHNVKANFKSYFKDHERLIIDQMSCRKYSSSGHAKKVYESI